MNASFETAIEQARDMHLEFYDIDTEYEEFIIDFPWPKNQGLMGKARKIGYRSDKFDWVERDYNHAHKRPYPSIVRPRQVNKKTHWGEIITDKVFSPPLKKPKPCVFAYLGRALDLEFDRGFGKENIDWKIDENFLPILGWHKKRKILIIQPLDAQPPMLLHSRILKVTYRGIEN